MATTHAIATDNEHTQATKPTMNVSQPERAVSLAGGSALALLGLKRGGLSGLALALLGGATVYRGMTGYCAVYNALGVNTADSQASAASVEKSVTINRPEDELYKIWRDFTNLPRFMKHLESVTTSDDRHSHWVATGPANSNVSWDAEITEDQPNQLIAWRSLPGAQVENSGNVRFEPAPGDRGTVVRVSLDYSPPAGVLGAAVAKLFGEEPTQQIEGDLRRFKSMVEAGEIPTVAGQSNGKRSVIGALLQPDPTPAQETSDASGTEASNQPAIAEQPSKPFQPKKPPVQQASEESFPASDPPAWTGTGTNATGQEVGS